jgi:RNA polymerase sigma-70 factor (ECF subfamily)
MSNLEQNFTTHPIMGSESFLKDIFHIHQASLQKKVSSIIRDEKAAENIVQEIFLKLWDQRNELNITNHGAYLNKMATNAAIDYLRQSRKLISFKKIHENYKAEGCTEMFLQNKELEAGIDKALCQLPPKCKIIFVLSRYHGLKYKEIAERLEISAKTVENQMGIALARMRRDLQPFLNASNNNTQLMLS